MPADRKRQIAPPAPGRRRVARRLLQRLVALWLLAPCVAAAEGEWFPGSLELHGFARTRLYTRVADFSSTPSSSSFRTELNIETDLVIYESDDWYVNFHAITRPVYEAVFDTQPGLYGSEVEPAAFGTGSAYPDNEFATRSANGQSFPGQGGQVDGEFTILNADTGSAFTGALAPAIAIDDVSFFGRLTAPVTTRGPNQVAVGGNASGFTYQALRDHFGVLLEPRLGLPPGTLRNGGLPLGSGLDASLGLASAPLSTPLNAYAAARGDAGSFEHSSFDVNRDENELKFGCFDNANPTCIFREFHLDVEFRDTFFRFGRQQIVWGKTDFFRLQDVVNPIDLGIHNVLADLEERRIPVLALDVVHQLGKRGPVRDLALELVWVWDRFLPDQFGQCGEAWAFTVACQVRAGAAGHQLLNTGMARSDGPDWSFNNTQPGVRAEFRLPKPAISISLSAFYGFQRRPVTRFRNRYSTENPNAAAMLLLQGNADSRFVSPSNPNGSVAILIDDLSELAQGFTPPHPHSGGTADGVWVDGFDPYDRSGPRPTAGGSLEAANQDLQNAWYVLTNVATPALGGCAGVPEANGELARCGGVISALALPWAASEAELEYPRLFSVGASMDYEIPKIATVLRLEMAGEIDHAIQNTSPSVPDGVSESSVYKLSVGLDRPVKIPFVNPERAAFLSFQTFLEHIVDYDAGTGSDDGMVPVQSNVISTFYMQNFWRNDTLQLTNLAAVDWNAGAVIWGPKLRWTYTQKLSFEVGLSLLWGEDRRHNVRDLCADGLLEGGGGCSFADPTTWQDGNWQLLNAPLERTTQAPFGFAKQSFADRFMRKRDEFWFGVTYQF